MGQPHHKHHAEQHPARRRRDQLRRLHRVRLPALVMIACAAVVVMLVATASIVGVPQGTPGRLEIGAFVAACVVFIHQLVMHVLPVSAESDYSGPGITERVSAWGVRRIDIHLTPRRWRRRKDD